MRTFFIYILASRKNGTLYIGVTNDIARRIWEHRNGQGDSFTRRYHVDRLVYIETFPTAHEAIGREKSLKKWPRKMEDRSDRARQSGVVRPLSVSQPVTSGPVIPSRHGRACTGQPGQ
jgi:putative endonuclease